MGARTLVETWYDDHAGLEEHRLEEGRLEMEMTLRVISDSIRRLSVDQVHILDIGGGPGRYSIELAKRGHIVTLNDLSDKCLDIARRRAESSSVRLQAFIHSDARNILQHVADVSFDVVLCLGPLYHLTTPQDRDTVVQNAVHAVKPGGYIILAYVTIYAHLRDMARRDPSRLTKEWDFYQDYLNTGKYTRRSDNESFHILPKNIGNELEAVKDQVEVHKVLSCEGILGFDGGRGLAGLGQEEMDRWVDVLMKSAEDEQSLNCAEHLLVVLRKK